MNTQEGNHGLRGAGHKTLIWGAALWLGTVLVGGADWAAAQRPSTQSHVPELARYLDRAEIAEPVVYRHLAVYPVMVKDGTPLRGGWLTADAAISRGVLVVTEKGGGSVPTIVVDNRSRSDHVFIMSGEVLSGGKQTRTVREDVVLAPGQRVELSVFCVEARRWAGSAKFSTGEVLLPQSIQQELRKGADQGRVWSEVARNNAALAAENATGSLERALNARPVKDKLAEVRRRILPKVPHDTVGFLFVDRGRALGAEFFGRDDLARALLPKLLDSYAVDCVLLGRGPAPPEIGTDNRAAIELFKRICRAGSRRTDTPGSGAGIRTRRSGLLGDGVGFGDALVHYGVQIRDRIVPLVGPQPRILPEWQNELPQRPR
jgi:hypothetical protein